MVKPYVIICLNRLRSRISRRLLQERTGRWGSIRRKLKKRRDIRILSWRSPPPIRSWAILQYFHLILPNGPPPDAILWKKAQGYQNFIMENLDILRENFIVSLLHGDIKEDKALEDGKSGVLDLPAQSCKFTPNCQRILRLDKPVFRRSRLRRNVVIIHIVSFQKIFGNIPEKRHLSGAWRQKNSEWAKNPVWWVIHCTGFSVTPITIAASITASHLLFLCIVLLLFSCPSITNALVLPTLHYHYIRQNSKKAVHRMQKCMNLWRWPLYMSTVRRRRRVFPAVRHFVISSPQ